MGYLFFILMFFLMFFLIFLLGHSLWKLYIKNRIPSLFEYKNRWVILLITAFVMGSYIFYYWNPLINFLSDNHNKIPGTIITALFAAPFAFWLWLWRDQNKIQDQKHKEEELKQADRDLKIRESNNDWENFFKFQRIIVHKGELTLDKASAVYALGEYYLKPIDTNFPQQVHVCFKMILSNYWQEKDPAKIIIPREDIQAIYTVISQKINIIRENNLSFEYFKLCRCVFFDEFLKCVNFKNSDLRYTNFSRAFIGGTHFDDADLRRSNIRDAYGSGMTFYNAIYDDETELPEGIDVETWQMRKIQRMSMNSISEIRDESHIPEQYR